MNTTRRYPTSAGAKFRTAVAESQPLQMVGVIAAYTAKMAEWTSFRAMYLSGGGMAANPLGIPDLGISTMKDVLINARRVTDAVQIPLMVGIDTGWDGAFNIARTIRSFIKTGVATVHLENQVGQRRCDHRPDKEVVSTDEMIDRVKAAVDAHTDDDFVIMARTDIAASEDIDAAVEHAVAYVKVSADMIFPEATKMLDDCRRSKAATRVPTLTNLTEFSNTPLFTTDELRSANVDIVPYYCGAHRAMNAVALNFYQTVIRGDTRKAVVGTMQSHADLYQCLGYHAYKDKFDALFAAQK